MLIYVAKLRVLECSIYSCMSCRILSHTHQNGNVRLQLRASIHKFTNESIREFGESVCYQHTTWAGRTVLSLFIFGRNECKTGVYCSFEAVAVYVTHTHCILHHWTITMEPIFHEWFRVQAQGLLKFETPYNPHTAMPKTRKQKTPLNHVIWYFL